MVSVLEAISFFNWAKWEVQREHGREKVNIDSYAREYGVNLDECMELVRKAVTTRDDIFVGAHALCTRINVLPDYELRWGTLIQDSDHLEGLCKVLLVYNGLIRDY